LKAQETQLLQASKSSTIHVASLDPDEGLSKVMEDLSVKGIELDTLTNKLKHKDAKITELEEHVKRREVLLAQINVAKEEAKRS
jgi:hypothetical protein